MRLARAPLRPAMARFDVAPAPRRRPASARPARARASAASAAAGASRASSASRCSISSRSRSSIRVFRFAMFSTSARIDWSSLRVRHACRRTAASPRRGACGPSNRRRARGAAAPGDRRRSRAAARRRAASSAGGLASRLRDVLAALELRVRRASSRSSAEVRPPGAGADRRRPRGSASVVAVGATVRRGWLPTWRDERPSSLTPPARPVPTAPSRGLDDLGGDVEPAELRHEVDAGRRSRWSAARRPGRSPAEPSARPRPRRPSRSRSRRVVRDRRRPGTSLWRNSACRELISGSTPARTGSAQRTVPRLVRRTEARRASRRRTPAGRARTTPRRRSSRRSSRTSRSRSGADGFTAQPTRKRRRLADRGAGAVAALVERAGDRAR